MREKFLGQEHTSIQIMALNLPQGQRPTTNLRDGPGAFTVRRLFVFIKEHLEFDYLEDEFIERNFFPDRIDRDYVLDAPGEYYRSERFLKLLIRKGRCKEFIECMHDMNHNVVYGRIRNFQNFEARTAWKAVENKLSFAVDDEMLQHHSDFLYTEIEPREIADEMFQQSLFTIDDHDYITDNPSRRKRLRNLLEILEKKQMHGRFLVMLKEMRHTRVLETLRTNSQFRHHPCDCADCIRHNFTFLQDELLETDDATDMVFSELTKSDLSDIKCCKGTLRQISKLIKILLIKRSNACEQFLKAIPVYLRRNDVIPKMKKRSADIRSRGKPVLSENLSCLTTQCLKDQKKIFLKNLEPVVVADLLFEEYNLPVIVHDKITETKYLRNQIRYLLKTLKEGTEDLFQGFLEILQRNEESQIICEQLGNLDTTSVGESMSSEKSSTQKHEIVREAGDVQNLPLEVRISMAGSEPLEQSVIDSVRSSNADISEATISIGQMDFSNITKGSVIIQLRPVTDDAAQTLLNAKENNRLFEMILGILRNVDIGKKLDDKRPLQIRVQVYYSKTQVAETNYGSLKATKIKQRIRIHKEKLLDELEPTAIIVALSKTIPSLKGALNNVRDARSCSTRIRLLLSLVEEGSPDCVEEFLSTLKKLGYSEIVKLIDPDNKAERVDPSTVHIDADYGSLKATKIKQRIRIYKEKLLDELEPTAIIVALSKTNPSLEGALEKVRDARSCKTKIHLLLSLVEEGSPDCVEEFLSTLKKLGYLKIVKLIERDSIANKAELVDPSTVHIDAEKIRKSIVLNYQNILDEMQISLAKETISKCVGDVHEMRKKIYEGGKSRRERMNNFLRLIIHDDYNVIKFAKVLKENGLEELLACEESNQRTNISAQEIELTIVGESFPLSSEGVLFDSVITLSNCDMVENTDAWIESINSETLSNLSDSFNIVIPEDPSQMSFTRNLLDTSKLDALVSQIRLLARKIVLCKHIKDEDKILGTVYVYEVAVKHKKTKMVIEEMDPREQLDFFHRKNDNLIKVLWIKGGSSDVPETKSKVHEKYKKILQLQPIYLHHEMEHYAKVAKLIVHKTIEAYISYIMSVKNGIPINHIGDIVSDAVNRALSKESITRLCFEAVIEERGNIYSDPYHCEGSEVERLKKELVQRTLESISKYLGEDISKEMQRHIVSDIKSKYNIVVNPFTKLLEISGLILLQTVLTIIAAIINPFAGVIVGIVSAVGTLILTVNVNSEAWRRAVASEIYENVSKNKQKVIRDVTSNIKERCKITIDELDNIAKQLETFRMRIDLSD